MKFFCFLLMLFFSTSCLGPDSFGAMVGDCDEFCTAYNVSRDTLKNLYGLRNRDFPDQKTGSQHVVEIGSGGILYEVNSWYREVNENGDTSIVDFSCIVKYDSNDVKYFVTDLKTKQR